ncbi:class F sortase [Cellulomonas oligotrophica]|uniref:Sortase (Surface protein transpeptidase) n=1 Tax=Cellulomonas oligotrophica TaxID=931536 RepID=A0A7Y9FHD9_9CELL|nr:class F sortase [Cellulomonas oligotrophica]NYD87383.1 sortase (surface protein transpeptidase) [Cellulomonas oligotrophica]GIG34529.1 hypothetical protein Col01nite_36880 [Cellulomonas oligotrophica]
MRAALAALATTGALVLTGCTGPAPDAPAVAPTATASVTPAPAATAEPTPAAVPDVPVQDASLAALQVAAPPAPVRVRVPDLDIDMPVDPVGVRPEGDMELPEGADRAAWYRFGPAPASPAGSTLIAAHVDSWTTGVGPFSRLRDVQPGALVEVDAQDGTVHTYRVSEVVAVPKDTAPVGEWFDREGSRRLVLVTCGGEFREDVGHYADNVVVTADPVEG